MDVYRADVTFLIPIEEMDFFFSLVLLFCAVLVISRGGKSTKILYSSKSTITLLKFYLSKSTSLKIYSSKSKK